MHYYSTLKESTLRLWNVIGITIRKCRNAYLHIKVITLGSPAVPIYYSNFKYYEKFFFVLIFQFLSHELVFLKREDFGKINLSICDLRFEWRKLKRRFVEIWIHIFGKRNIFFSRSLEIFFNFFVVQISQIVELQK